MLLSVIFFFFFFFNDPATTEIYTLSLHDALPICLERFESPRIALADLAERDDGHAVGQSRSAETKASAADRKSTRLNSSHRCISYAVFCLKKKKKNNNMINATTIRQANNLQTHIY